MLNGVRERLLLTYIGVMLVSIGVSVGTMLAILGTRPAPPEPTYRDILNVITQIDIASLRPQWAVVDAQETWITNLFSAAAENDVRVLVIDTQTQAVLRDSFEAIPAGQTLQINPTDVTQQRIERGTRLRLPFAYNTGRFADEAGTEWLFIGVGVELRPQSNNGERENRPRPGGILGGEQRNQIDRAILFAAEHPSISLIQAIRLFGADLSQVILLAAGAGAVVALLMAIIVSRMIARPLRLLADGAHAVAGGDYTYRVQEIGPNEMRELAGAFNNMSEQVRLNNAAQRDLLANVSHDLKTPLTSIQGFSGAIMDGTAPDIQKAAAIINEEAARLTRLVGMLTELARIRAGRLNMRQDMLDMGAMVEAMVQRIDVVAHKKGITIETQIQPTPMIQGDGDRLAQVVNNLLSNAVKYTPNRGHVAVSVAASGAGVQLTVQDNGIGIPPEDISRIFDRFYQVDKSRGPSRGHGLGLAITKEIVAAHNGNITVSSNGEGKGSTFTVWLPGH